MNILDENNALQAANAVEKEQPPILGSWNRLYTFVLLLHAIIIGIFYLFTMIYK